MVVSITTRLRGQTLLALLVSVCVVGSIYGQNATPHGEAFSLTGRVVAKSKYGFEVRTDDGKNVDVAFDENTDFALRMSRPSFNVGNGIVAVDGPGTENGQRRRVRLKLPEGKLYLLVQFRNENQRKRVLSKSPWRLNNYLIGSEPIESVLPRGNEVLLSGEVDLKTSELKIDQNRYPIRLGFRGATLGGRSIADINVDQTSVAISGVVAGSSKLAKTVLFVIQ